MCERKVVAEGRSSAGLGQRARYCLTRCKFRRPTACYTVPNGQYHKFDVSGVSCLFVLQVFTVSRAVIFVVK
jgi:hypothetical protein